MLDDHTLTLPDAIEMLRTHQRDAAPQPKVDRPATLPLNDIEALPVLFQPRSLENDVADGHHVAELVDILERRGNLGLDPITVYWSGKTWFVIDGHHRRAAYSQSESWDDKPVPVETFDGGVDEAIAEAVERNTKVTLPMLKADRSNAGWRLVCLGSLRVKEVVAMANISTSLVKQMRARKRELLERYPDRFTAEKLATYPWRQVLDPNFPEPVAEDEIDDEWVTKLAHDFHGRLRKAFADKLAKNPDAFAMAIRMLHNGLPGMLMESNDWSTERERRLDAWQAERSDQYDF